GVQLRICQGIFGNISGEILAAVKRLGQEMERDEGRAPVLVFYEFQTLTLLKAAFLFKSQNDPDKAPDNIDLGKALLAITDLIEGQPGDITNTESDQPDADARWLQYTLLYTLPIFRRRGRPLLCSCGY